VDQLQASILREVQKDFEKYRSDIKEDISQSILARYVPESMLIERGVKTDKQVKAAVKLLSNRNSQKYEKLLSRDEDGIGSSGSFAIYDGQQQQLVGKDDDADTNNVNPLGIKTSSKASSESVRSSIQW